MPHTLKNESTGVVITFSGTVDGDEIYELNQQLINDERFLHWRYQIWDFSGIDKIEVSMDQLRSFAYQDSIAAHINPDQRVALIARRTARSGLDSLFHLLEEEWGGYQSKTFYSVDAARKWAESRKK